jgi:hypothetical protein
MDRRRPALQHNEFDIGSPSDRNLPRPQTLIVLSNEPEANNESCSANASTVPWCPLHVTNDWTRFSFWSYFQIRML